MSHEIRTPLNAILGFTTILKEQSHDPDEQKGLLQLIENSGSHLLNVINDILDLSKVEAGKMEFSHESCSVWRIVEEVMASFQVQADEKKLALRGAALTRLPVTIESDGMRLKQLLTNLTGNAIKFTEEGGVELSVGYEEKENGIGNAEPWLTIEVKDSGIGIHQECLDRLFNPFHQADSSILPRFGGTGLGLAISQRIVEGLKGTIDVESSKGKGSLFRVSLPITLAPDSGFLIPEPFAATDVLLPTSGAVAEEKKGEEGEAPKSSRPLAGVHVLSCEDGQTNRALVELILERAGARVTSAPNGQEGVALYGKNPKAFDVILMDIQMPVMDGYAATASLREIGCKLPIIALTAHAMKGDKERALQIGCNNYLTKPLDVKALTASIQEELSKGQTESAPAL